jgi:hypothetical protein
MSKSTDYQCVMVEPPKRLLKSRTMTLTGTGVRVEGFTRDANGKDIPNGIEFMLLTEVTGISWR